MKKAIDIGITNISQYLIYNYILHKESFSKKIKIDGITYFKLNFDLAQEELPLMRLKEDTLYRHLLYFERKGIISFKKLHKKKEYIKIIKK